MKINIIIDGNYLLYKNVFVLKKYKSLNDLNDLLDRELNNLSKSFPYDNIYFVSDAKEGNWRKSIYKEYKGTRKKDESIDWETVYETYSMFKRKVKKQKNIKFLEMPGLEGDDLIAHIVHETNKTGHSNIIVGSDGDLRQLLDFDLNKKYINVQWNYKFSDERLYLPENYQIAIDEFSKNETNIFDMDNSSEFINFLETLIQKTKVATTTKEEVILTKMIEGDKGDNIPKSVLVKEGKVNPEGRGIGKDGALTVYKLYKEIHPEPVKLDSDEFIDKLSDVIIYYKKIKDTTAKDTIKKQLTFNRMMMYLNPQLYMPSDIYNNMILLFNDVNNRVVEYEVVDLEKQLEENDFFNEGEVEDIPEQFRQEKSEDEEFDPDSFWDL